MAPLQFVEPLLQLFNPALEKINNVVNAFNLMM